MTRDHHLSTILHKKSKKNADFYKNIKNYLPAVGSSSTLKFQQNTLILLTWSARGRFPPGTILHKKGKKNANF
jgi:hypothetical protein